jgi:hypothetical protein
VILIVLNLVLMLVQILARIFLVSTEFPVFAIVLLAVEAFVVVEVDLAVLQLLQVLLIVSTRLGITTSLLLNLFLSKML